MTYKLTDKNICGAILSGGKNLRMNGVNKAFVKINGFPVIRRTIDLFKKMFNEIILVTNSPEEYIMYKRDAIIIEDIIRNVGPLGGIHSALCRTSKTAVFFVACDMPFLHNGLIKKQMDYFNRTNCDVLIPSLGQAIEPLHGIYKKSINNKLERFLKTNKNYAIRNFLKKVNVECIDFSKYGDMFKNINTPGDLTDANKIKTQD